ncbi:S-layer homology domain-containing protein [Vallitalea guaymasensis]|uniref:S-layer homology domain-containing protein n=1 Tax=Vallitalea guaymasensis TaxID=1185412 RepID=UPI00272C802D|nr:S-layer homology domain-containing protein [Vallitalea guaymasensis]
MKYFQSFKRILALALVLVLMAVPVNINASGTQADLDDINGLLRSLTDEMFKTGYANETANLVQAIYDIENKQAFISAFNGAFAELDGTNRELINEFNISMEAISTFVTFVQDNQGSISISNLTTYIRNRQRSEFINALSNHQDEINALLINTGVTEEILHSGYNKLDTIFSLYDDAKRLNTKFFTYNTQTKQLSLRESEVHSAIAKINAIKDYFDDPNKVIDSLNVFVTYYNSSTNNSDKTTALNYLMGTGIVYNHTPSSGGGDDNSGNGGGYIPSTGDGDTPPATNEELDDIANQLNNGKLSEEESATMVEEVVSKLNDDLTKVKDQLGAYNALKSVSQVLTSTEKVVEKLQEPEARKAVVEEIEKTLDNTVAVLGLIKNSSTVSVKAKALIKDVAGIKDALKDNVEETKQLQQAAVEIAELAVNKAGTVKVSSSNIKVSNGKATADLSKFDYKSQLKKAKDAKKDMDKVLADNKISGTKDMDVKITLEVPTSKTTKEVNVTLPDLTDAFASVDKVTVESDIASFELSAGTFGSEEASEVKLSASNINVDTLTNDQKAALPSGVETVIDLDAHVAGDKVTEFNNPIQVAVPYVMKKGEDPERISVYLLTDSGEVVKAAGRYNPLTGKISVMRKHFSKYFVSASTDSFSDLSGYGWAEKPIEILAGKGIINGKGEGKYDPSAKVTRAEFVSLIVRMYQLDANNEEQPFEDVSDDIWYAKDVAAAYQNGIINGVSKTKFAPNNTITKQEAAKVIMNVLDNLGYKEEENGNLIKDVFADYDGIASWAKNAVSTTFREDIFTGKSGDEFNPKEDTSRAQAAVMIYNLYLVD